MQERLDPPGRFVQVVDWDEVEVEDLVGAGVGDSGEGAGSIDMEEEEKQPDQEEAKDWRRRHR